MPKGARGTCEVCKARALAAKKKVNWGNCREICVTCSRNEKRPVLLHTSTNCFAERYGIDAAAAFSEFWPAMNNNDDNPV